MVWRRAPSSGHVTAFTSGLKRYRWGIKPNSYREGARERGSEREREREREREIVYLGKKQSSYQSRHGKQEARSKRARPSDDVKLVFQGRTAGSRDVPVEVRLNKEQIKPGIMTTLSKKRLSGGSSDGRICTK
jgi:hypothetical protein